MVITTGKPVRILGVRDEAGRADLLACSLRKQGYTGHLATTVEQALAISQDQEFEVAVFPITKVQRGDFSLLKQFRSMFSPWKLPIIVAGGFHHGSQITEALRWGANDFIIIDAASQPELLLARIQLVLDRKTTEGAFRNSEKEKERSVFQTRFLSMISHELRTPLTIMLSSAELLKFQASPANKVKAEKYYSQIRRAARHMASLLGDALRLGKAKSGKLQTRPAVVDLVEMVERLIGEFRASVKHRNPLSLRIHGKRRPLMLDPNLLTAVLYNLLSNAAKYSAEGSPVELEIQFTSSKIVLQVTDRGIGIPREDLEHVFDAFHRAGNTGGFPGVGLGLASVREFIELEGGQVTLASEEGCGTTVTIVLPARECDR